MALPKRGVRMLVAGLLVLGASACSAGEDEPESIDHPRQPDTLVISYRWTPGDTLAASESYWVYGDRRVITVEMPEDDDKGTAPVEMEIEIALESQMQYFLSRLRTVGILTGQDANFGSPEDPVGPVTWYVNADNIWREVTYQRSHNYDPRLTENQRQKRMGIRYRVLGQFGDASDGPGKKYQPASTALLVKAVSKKGGRAVRDWPLVDLDQAVRWDGNEVLGNRCMIVPSEKADKITAAMKESKDGVAWRSSGELYRVRPHPLLPHEKDCATVRPYFWPS